ncbi:MAG: N-acetylmuramic acid 6-phosphate etherase [Spirochaetaceae bacterium]
MKTKIYKSLAEHEDKRALSEMIHRLIPQHEERFELKLLKNYDNDEYFEISNNNGKIVLSGNNNLSICCALNHYLKYDCKTMVSWLVENPVEVPDVLPQATPVWKSSILKDRFFLNYCTFSYSMPYWGWNEWERLIDWMALNGINMPLAITGQEAIWQTVWNQLGLSKKEILNFFTGPAYLPFQRMGIIDKWGGALPESYIINQKKLQKKILSRQRSFNMRPVLPAFCGHIPFEITKYIPEISIKQLESWNGFEREFSTWFLDPQDPYFDKIQKLFLKEQEKQFGYCEVYAADPFNELIPPSWEPDYLAEVSETIYNSLKKSNNNAVWLQMSWLFYHNSEQWTPPRVKAYLSAVPKDKLIMLDYYCENRELWRETDGFYSQNFLWCYLGNFGGQTKLLGPIDLIEEKLNKAFTDSRTETMTGIGLTLEGLDDNPHVYDYLLERIWQDEPIDTSKWIQSYAERRCGKDDKNVKKAWSLLHKSIYSHYTNPELFCGGFIRTRPGLDGRSCLWGDDTVGYDNSTLLEAIELLCIAYSNCLANDRFRFDLVNFTREFLVNHSGVIRKKIYKAYIEKNINDFNKYRIEFEDLIKDIASLLSSRSEFRLDSWLNLVRNTGETTNEIEYYEKDARNIISKWGSLDNNELVDYANRDLSAMYLTYHLPRWQLFFDACSCSLREGNPIDEDKLNKQMNILEWDWVIHPSITEEAYTDEYKIVKKLTNKYKKNRVKYILIDIGGSWIKGSLAVGVHPQKISPTKKVRSPLGQKASSDDLFFTIIRLIEMLGSNRVDAIVISTAGIVNYHGTCVEKCSPHLRPLNESGWIDKLKHFFNCPVSLINDADAALIGASEKSLISTKGNTGLMVIGTGLGFSVLKSGRRWRPGGEYTLLGSLYLDGKSMDERISASALSDLAEGDLVAFFNLPSFESERKKYLKVLREAVQIAVLMYQLDEVLISGGLVEACNRAGFNLQKQLEGTTTTLRVLKDGNLLQMIGAAALAHSESVSEKSRFGGDHSKLRTEDVYNPTLQLQNMSPLELSTLFLEAELESSRAIKKSLPEISLCTVLITERIRNGGRLIYVGCGSSGRIAALDAVELNCTYGFPKEDSITLISGGLADACLDIEYNYEEDASSIPELLLIKPKPEDVIIGISASSTAYYVRSALAAGKDLGCLTILISDIYPEIEFFDQHIALNSGPEVVCGSTRMKAGTATKKVLNTLSSSVMIQLGKVEGSYMIEVACVNEKLQKRAQTILKELFSIDKNESRLLLEDNNYQLQEVIQTLRKR